MNCRLKTAAKDGVPWQLVEVADAAMHQRVAAVDYGGDGPRFVVVQLFARAPKGRALACKRAGRGTFAEHLYVEGLLPAAPFEARALVEATAAALAAAPAKLHGVDLGRLARDVRASAANLPLAEPLATVQRKNELAAIDFDEARRRRLERPLRKLLGGARMYGTPELDEATGAEASALADVLANLLAREGLKTPGYSEIYFNVGGSLDAARLLASAVEDWHENAYAVVDPKAYGRASAAKREAMLVDAYGEALLRLAAIDGLDEKAIRRVIGLVGDSGVATELWGPGAKNATHEACVVYRRDSGVRTARFRLVVVDKRSGKRREHDLGEHSVLWWPYRFAKVSLTRKVVRIDAAKGGRADAYMKKEARRIEVAIEGLFGGA